MRVGNVLDFRAVRAGFASGARWIIAGKLLDPRQVGLDPCRICAICALDCLAMLLPRCLTRQVVSYKIQRSKDGRRFCSGFQHGDVRSVAQAVEGRKRSRGHSCEDRSPGGRALGRCPLDRGCGGRIPRHAGAGLSFVRHAAWVQGRSAFVWRRQRVSAFRYRASEAACSAHTAGRGFR